ncbi:MAG: hypothetical protein IJH41_01935 [Eubacterium sp.]|nr:hypothetical protein [Eubacterium sp.]
MTVVFCMCSCGGSSSTSAPEEKAEEEEPAAEEYKDVELVEYGYSVSDVGSIKIGAVVKNPDEKTAYDYPTIVVTAYDDKGDVIVEEEDTLQLILPGEQLNHGGLVTIDEETADKIDKVELSVKSGYAVEPPEDISKPSDFEIKEVKDETDSDTGLTVIAGLVKNNFSSDVETVKVSALFRKDGKIVCGSYAYVDDLGVGEEKPFEFMEVNLPEYDDYELSVTR